MDLLASGSERTAAERVDRALRRRAPRGLVVALTAAHVTVLACAVTSVSLVREAVERDADRVALAIGAESVVAVRGRGRDGSLVLEARNLGARPVTVSAVEVDVAGVRGGGDVAGLLVPGASTRLAVPFSVRDCAALARVGQVRLTAAPEGRPAREVPLQVGGEGELSDDLFAAGCRPVSSPDVVVVAVRALGGERRQTSAGIAGRYEVEVRNEGAELRHIRVHGEVPGVLFSTAAFIGVPPGARLQARLPFAIPDCAALRRTGRLVVTVLRDGRPYLELGFRATEDEEAGTVRDVDLDLVLGACGTAAAGEVGPP